MTKEQTYTQCKYAQETATGKKFDVAWIPSNFAKVGKKIRIDDKDGVWTIESVGSTKSAKTAMEDSRDYLKQREASDIKKRPKKVICDLNDA